MIALANLIAENNYEQAEHLVMANGFDKPQSKQQTVNAINHLLEKNGEDFLSQLADIHPDYELIERRVLEKNKTKCEQKPAEAKSNTSGHEEKSYANAQELKSMFVKEMQIADEQTSNLDGKTTTVTNKNDKYLQMLALGCATVLAGILIWKIA